MFHRSLRCSSKSMIIYVLEIWNDLKDEICLECTINTYRENIKCNRQTTHSQNLHGDNCDIWRFKIVLIQFYRLQRLTDKLSFNRQRPDLWRLRGWCHAARFLHIHEYWGWFEPTRDKTDRQDSQHEIKIGRIYVLHTHSWSF